MLCGLCAQAYSQGFAADDLFGQLSEADFEQTLPLGPGQVGHSDHLSVSAIVSGTTGAEAGVTRTAQR